jgi:tetratricopeptide (TPR) repeat protein
MKSLSDLRAERDELMKVDRWLEAFDLALVLVDEPSEANCNDLVAMSVILSELGDPAGAKAWLKLALGYPQVDSRAQVMWACNQVEEGAFAEAIDSLNTALLKFTNEETTLTRIHGLLGCAYQSVDLLSLAISSYVTALEIDGSNFAALFGLLRTYLKDGQYQNVIDLVKVHPSMIFPTLSLQLRSSLLAFKAQAGLGNVSEALQNMRTLRSVAKEAGQELCGEIESFYINLLIDSGCIREAEPALDAALAAFPDDPTFKLQHQQISVIKKMFDQRMSLESLL